MCKINNNPNELEQDLKDIYKAMGFGSASEDEEESVKKAAEWAFSEECKNILKGCEV